MQTGSAVSVSTADTDMQLELLKSRSKDTLPGRETYQQFHEQGQLLSTEKVSAFIGFFYSTQPITIFPLKSGDLKDENWAPNKRPINHEFLESIVLPLVGTMVMNSLKE